MNVSKRILEILVKMDARLYVDDPALYAHVEDELSVAIHAIDELDSALRSFDLSSHLLDQMVASEEARHDFREGR